MEAEKALEERQQFDETTYNLGHAAENAAQIDENIQGALDRVQPTGTMTRVPSGGPYYTQGQAAFATTVNDPVSAMFVNTAVASRAIWIAMRSLFGGGG
ncbi:MAG TPA: hypothetical protein DHU96_12625 [Actinobacteria bacterium]|nr:hypothetical protein [Actinomycetota bacterium]